MKAQFKDQIVTIIDADRGRGWVYVEFADGMQRNIQRKELTMIEEEIREYTLAEAIAEAESFPLEAKIRRCGDTTYNPDHYIKAKSLNGSYTLHNGDSVALKLAEKTLDEIYSHAAIMLNLPKQELIDKYAHLNPGMARMNLGNRLRACYRKNGKVTEFKV